MVTLRVFFLDSLNCVPISQYDQSCKINNYLASSKKGGGGGDSLLVVGFLYLFSDLLACCSFCFYICFI